MPPKVQIILFALEMSNIEKEKKFEKRTLFHNWQILIIIRGAGSTTILIYNPF